MLEPRRAPEHGADAEEPGGLLAERPPRARVVERGAEPAHGMGERQASLTQYAKASASRGTRPRKTTGSTTSTARSDAVRASRASAPSSAPAAPTTAAASATPTSRSGMRAHGSPPVTPPSSTTIPKTTAIAAPSASADDRGERDLRPHELPERHEPAPQPADRALVALRGRARRRRAAARGTSPCSAIPYDCTCADSTQLRPLSFGCAQLDRMRGRLQRGARLRERRAARRGRSRGSPARAAPGGMRREQPLRAVEPEHRELPAEEAARCRRAGAAARRRGSP